MFLTREQIVAQQWPSEEVPLPEFGDGAKVMVKTLTVGEFLRLVDLEKAHPNCGPAMWWVTSVTDGEGKPIFTEADVNFLTTLPIGTLNRVVEAAKRVNKMADAKGTAGPNA